MKKLTPLLLLFLLCLPGHLFANPTRDQLREINNLIERQSFEEAAGFTDALLVVFPDDQQLLELKRTIRQRMAGIVMGKRETLPGQAIEPTAASAVKREHAEAEKALLAAFHAFGGTWRTQAQFDFNGENDFGDPVRIRQSETITFRIDQGREGDDYRFRYERSGNWSLTGRDQLMNQSIQEDSAVEVTIDTGFLKPIVYGRNRAEFLVESESAGTWRTKQQGKLAPVARAVETSTRRVVLDLEARTLTLFPTHSQARIHQLRLSPDGRRLYISTGLPSGFSGNFASVPEENLLRVSRQPYYPVENWGGFADHVNILFLEKRP